LRRRAGLPGAEQNNIWLLGKTSRKRPDDKASTKKDAPRARSASGKEAEVTTLSHSAHFVSWVFATVNSLNNAMLAIIFLAMEDFFRRRNSFECDRAVVPRFPGC